MPGAFAITVEFRVKPGMLDEFRPLMDENARASMREEPGCRRFDVLQPLGQPDVVFLYEIYDDRAAFEAHVRSPHFQRFQADSASLVVAKTVVEYELVCEGGENLS
jgi:(4S)-4-hydroxy-5-phosphonooxypentane-2,3-dione isomerase